LLLAAGCAPAPSGAGEDAAAGAEPAPALDGGGRCDAAAGASLTGRQKSEAAGKEALRLTGAAALRWIEPDTMVTMDHRTDRLNIEVDAAGRITRLRCG
jgi:hypothetical protein